MKTLVTGATGFIGGHVVRKLSRAGHGVRVLLRAKSDRRGLEGCSYEAVEGDLLDPDSVRRAVEGCDLVYHLAALMSTRSHLADRIFAVNVGGAANLFSACLTAGTPRVVYAASIFALGGPETPHPVDETVTYNLQKLPVPYFQSRRKAEEDAWRFVDRGLPIVFLYPCFCFGPGDVYISSTRVLLNFLRMPVPLYPKGGINAVDVRDVAEAFVASATRGRIGERYLLGGENLSYKDFFTRAARVAGRRAPILPMLTGPTHLLAHAFERTLKKPPLDVASAILLTRYWYYDSSKAARELHFGARPIEETLVAAVDDLRRRGLVDGRS
jgi:dihydroflavonol-4-reductase